MFVTFRELLGNITQGSQNVRSYSLIIMSLLGVQETKNRPGLEEIMARGEKISCGMRRTSRELDKCPAE